MLGDPSGNRYAQTQTDEAIRTALSEYSTASPNVATAAFTVISAGREHAITGLVNCQFLTRVQWPADADPNNNVITTWFANYSDGIPMLHFQWDTLPIGAVINLAYAANHTISGLDSAAVTTTPPVHDSLLALGAAAHAAIARSTQITEQMTSRASNSGMLLTWGTARLQEFRAGLGMLTVTKTALFQPKKGWPLDSWDRQNEPNQPFF
jgi:hypothetical protein